MDKGPILSKALEDGRITVELDRDEDRPGHYVLGGVIIGVEGDEDRLEALFCQLATGTIELCPEVFRVMAGERRRKPDILDERARAIPDRHLSEHLSFKANALRLQAEDLLQLIANIEDGGIIVEIGVN